METSSLVFKSASASATVEYSRPRGPSGSGAAVEGNSGVTVIGMGVSMERETGASVGPGTEAAELLQAERTENMRTPINNIFIKPETLFRCFRCYPTRIVQTVWKHLTA